MYLSQLNNSDDASCDTNSAKTTFTPQHSHTETYLFTKLK